MITAWPWLWAINPGEPPINIAPTVENIEAFITKFDIKARFWKFVQYNDIPKEGLPNPKHPPQGWPNRGKIDMRNVEMKYR